MNATYVLAARLEAKPTKAQEVVDLLSSVLPDVVDEPGTAAWLAVRFGLLEFGLYVVFPDETARRTHLAGTVAAALKAHAHLFEDAPVFETADVLAAKPLAGAPRQEGHPTAPR